MQPDIRRRKFRHAVARRKWAQSSALGGTSIGATRYLAGVIDPLAIGALRFGVLALLPIDVLQGGRWPVRRDWPLAAALGLLFFGLFPLLFNASLVFTTAARGALALSTLPLLTMVVGALLGTEQLTLRKTIGVVLAMSGVAMALVAGLASAPPGVWRGDALMIGAASCMAVYSVWSKPVIARSSPLPFAAMARGVGAISLILRSGWQGSLAPIAAFGTPQRIAVLYLGIVGGAVTFIFWVFALGRTTPTRVAISIAVIRPPHR